MGGEVEVMSDQVTWWSQGLDSNIKIAMTVTMTMTECKSVRENGKLEEGRRCEATAR